MRLIDADALIEKMDDKYSLGEIGRRERDDVVNALEFEPTIQPEIVRCEECLYRKICSWEKQGAKFCSFAERREVTNGN